MINIDFNTAAKKMGSKWSGSNWTAPEGAEDVFAELSDKYFDNPVAVEITINDDNRDTGKYLGYAHALAVCGYVIATAKGRDSGARIADGIAIIDGSVNSGGSMKNYRCVISGDAIRVRMKVGAGMLDELKKRQDIDLVVRGEPKTANPLEKFSDEELLSEVSRRGL